MLRMQCLKRAGDILKLSVRERECGSAIYVFGDVSVGDV